MMNNVKEQGSRSYLIGIVTVAVLGGLLFGYDTAVISGAKIGLEIFFLKAKDFQYADEWYGFTNSSALIGCIIGSALSGLTAIRLGHKTSLVIAGLLLLVSALGAMYPEFLLFTYDEPSYNLIIMFNVYRIIGGVGIGLAAVICPMYIGEIAPSDIQDMPVSRDPLAIIIVLLAVYLVNYFLMGNLIKPLVELMGWRSIFGSEAIVAAIFSLLVSFVPETPRHLISIGRSQMALSILGRINGPSRAQQLLLGIKDTMILRTEHLMAGGAACIFAAILLISYIYP